MQLQPNQEALYTRAMTEIWIVLGSAVGLSVLIAATVMVRAKPLAPPQVDGAAAPPAGGLPSSSDSSATGDIDRAALPVPLNDALQATREGFWGRLRGILGQGLSETEAWESMEEALYLSDVGSRTVQRLLAGTRKHFSRLDASITPARLRDALSVEISEIFAQVPAPTAAESHPEVWLVVGVNGVGKTTTLGKLAHQWASRGESVLVAAGDTFRAAAAEQLSVWADRAAQLGAGRVECFSGHGTKDPGAIAYQAMEKAEREGFQRVIVDTAGRLHTAQHLMEELAKVKRVLGQRLAGAPHQTVLILDASQGQNALVQARQFHEALNITGVIFTKLDGTAKGGVALGVVQELQIPILYIGVGEKPEDLRSFQPTEFVAALLANA